MSYSGFLFYFWLIFAWCGLGMLLIAIAVIRELLIQWKQRVKRDGSSQI